MGNHCTFNSHLSGKRVHASKVPCPATSAIMVNDFEASTAIGINMVGIQFYKETSIDQKALVFTSVTEFFKNVEIHKKTNIIGDEKRHQFLPFFSISLLSLIENILPKRPPSKLTGVSFFSLAFY